ncbi:MAG: TIGR03086 family metal-binding protein [Acidimicrobiia bacterium]|nr:TIGR03086 family metal-binding protein [Acidimicrobiia bacterium]MDH5289983.1 TIGR03086 family metal-binding protein [Acidimicrobiia bacterium]
MTVNLRNFTRSVYGFDAVVRRVPATAWSNPSPCEGWTASHVVAHQIGVLDGVARAARGEDIGLPAEAVELSDPLAAWAVCRDSVLEALDRPGALQRSGKYWFGEMSVDTFIGIVQWDPLAHAWDISRAAGMEPVPDDELAQSSLDTIGAMAGTLRKWKLIGEPVEIGHDAPLMHRFLALIGRRPA